MDIVRLRIPYRFLRDRTRMSWRGIRFGLVNELVDPEAPVALAVDQIDEFAEPSATLVDLAGAAQGEFTMEYVDLLADGEPQRSEDEIRDEWLYLVMAWTYEHRDQYLDPLQRVEEIYADFGYPEQVEGFVRYMPMVGPDLGSHAANERRLFERWRTYLEEVGSAYSP